MNVKAEKNKKSNQYPVHPLILNRWSPRAFRTERISDDQLNTLFEAARWAPSSMNEQPWRFIYAYKGEKEFELILESLMEGNRVWAKNAPVLMITVIKEKFSKNDKPNKSAAHDLGLAVGNLSIQATELGIGLHQMAGFSAEKAKQLLDIPEGYSAFTAIALGFYGSPEQLTGTLKERELATRKRKEISEFTFHGKFSFEKE